MTKKPSKRKPVVSDMLVLVLAAGQSRRLGYPKQLLRLEGRTLLARLIDTLQEASHSEIYVVTGAFRDQCVKELEHRPEVYEIFHPDFANGMGSSLKAGLRHLITKKGESLQRVLITSCDQIYLSPDHIKAMIEASTYHPPLVRIPAIVASQYEDVFGIPAIFPSWTFSELLQIDDDQGGKSILHRHRTLLKLVNFSKGHLDIDEARDLQRLQTLERQLTSST